MRYFTYAVATFFALVAVQSLGAAVSGFSLANEIQRIRSLPMAARPAATKKLALEVRTLAPGREKVDIAELLSHRATEGDDGQDIIQAVADTLSQALEESPIAAKGDKLPSAYIELATLVRYKHVSTSLTNPLLTKA